MKTKTIATFPNEHAVRAFAQKSRMKFANSCAEGEAGYADFARDMKTQGLAVLRCRQFSGGRSALLAFHR